MKTQLGRLRDALGIELLEQQDAGILCIHKSERLVFKITVPYDVLEWFVGAHDDSGAVWSEWTDYYPCYGETREQLAAAMVLDVERFVTALAQAETRVLHDHSTCKRVVELRTGNTWKKMSLAWMTAGPEENSAQT